MSVAVCVVSGQIFPQRIQNQNGWSNMAILATKDFNCILALNKNGHFSDGLMTRVEVSKPSYMCCEWPNFSRAHSEPKWLVEHGYIGHKGF